ncbi:hypothetical protein [Pseudomonas arsenicoxydans]|uniref:Uncharacterized protein n=1 Tax=Pseudomonas arsenicoxydans TaxID=702115 RepID=A0A4P6G2I0_9PSED|nr:hypothetical protein [Pseudomonas arsenicoxydans]QAY83490.1 hypothetical protein CUN61_05660 [Pseudomonas arsenicoxydans]
MKKKNLFALLFIGLSFTVSAAEKATVSAGDVYEVDEATQSLKVSWSGGSKIVDGVIGDKGEVTRDFVDFNGTKALHYENLASSTPFEAYFTLSRQGDNVVVDCIYANIRNDRNGILINKAVCDLNRPLAEDYEESIYEFSDEWKNASGKVSIESLGKTPAVALNVDEAQYKDIHLVRTYKSKDDLVSKSPSVAVTQGSIRHQFSSGTIFSVYKVSDLKSPRYLEVAAKGIEESFTRYDYEALKALLK